MNMYVKHVCEIFESLITLWKCDNVLSLYCVIVFILKHDGITYKNSET